MSSRRISSFPTTALGQCLLLAITFLISSAIANTLSTTLSNGNNYNYQGRRDDFDRASLAARRSADDSPWPHPTAHLNAAASQELPIVVGKLKAPAPQHIHHKRIKTQSKRGSQTVSASYRVSDNSDLPEKVVHGLVGDSSFAPQKQAANQRTVSAKMLVSDEGLNYPPSKLSADIYGNVAEIVTAPPEAVENDFLLPESSKIFGARRLN